MIDLQKDVEDLRKRKLKGSTTVEMAFLMPIILMIFMSCMFAIFYFHDKAVISGAAYETAVVGSTKMREKKKVTESELQALLTQRIGRKCIFYGGVNEKVSIEKEAIIVKVSAKKRRFGLSVEKRAAITEPEKEIRKKRRVEGLLSGA